MVNTQFDRITVDPDRLRGKPCIRELRISVGMVVQMVAAGKTMLAANLDQVREVLITGAIVVFSLGDIRVRPLPLTPHS